MHQVPAFARAHATQNPRRCRFPRHRGTRGSICTSCTRRTKPFSRPTAARTRWSTPRWTGPWSTKEGLNNSIEQHWYTRNLLILLNRMPRLQDQLEIPQPSSGLLFYWPAHVPLVSERCSPHSCPRPPVPPESPQCRRISSWAPTKYMLKARCSIQPTLSVGRSTRSHLPVYWNTVHQVDNPQ